MDGRDGSEKESEAQRRYDCSESPQEEPVHISPRRRGHSGTESAENDFSDDIASQGAYIFPNEEAENSQDQTRRGSSSLDVEDVP